MSPPAVDQAAWIQLGAAGLLTVLWWVLRQGINEIKTDIKSLVAVVGGHLAAIEVLRTRLDKLEDEMGEVREQIQQLDRRERVS